MKTTSFSSTILNRTKNDSIVLLTPIQLKYTNLIFVEHLKLLKENELLHELINSYNEMNLLLLVSDSIKLKQIGLYNDWVSSLQKDITNKLKRIIMWKGIGITTSILLLLNLIIK